MRLALTGYTAGTSVGYTHSTATANTTNARLRVRHTRAATLRREPPLPLKDAVDELAASQLERRLTLAGSVGGAAGRAPTTAPGDGNSSRGGTTVAPAQVETAGSWPCHSSGQTGNYCTGSAFGYQAVEPAGVEHRHELVATEPAVRCEVASLGDAAESLLHLRA